MRVSTDRQTVENQELQLRQVAERRGWEVVEVYNDAGISGARDRKQRQGLDKMLNEEVEHEEGGSLDKDIEKGLKDIQDELDRER